MNKGLKIEYVSFIPGSNTPARVFRDKGIIQVNLSRWNNLPEFTKKFILAHEEGHYNQNTINEFLADKYAFNKLALTEPFSLKKSVSALSDVLSMTSPEHYSRVNAAIVRALKTDAYFNGNKEAEKHLKKLTEIKPQTLPTGFKRFENFNGNEEKTMIPTEKIMPSIGHSFIDTAIKKTVKNEEFLTLNKDQAQGWGPTIGKPTFRELFNTEPVTYIFKNGELVQIPVNNPEILPDSSELKTIANEMVNTQSINESITMSKKNLVWILIIVVLLTALFVKLFQK